MNKGNACKTCSWYSNASQTGCLVRSVGGGHNKKETYTVENNVIVNHTLMCHYQLQKRTMVGPTIPPPCANTMSDHSAALSLMSSIVLLMGSKSYSHVVK